MAEKPPVNKKIDARVAARMQKDVDGFIMQYDEILRNREKRYAKELLPTWKRIERNVTEELRKIYKEIEDANGVPITKQPIPEAKLRNMKRRIKSLQRLQLQFIEMVGIKDQINKLGRNLAYGYADSYYFHAFVLEQATRIAVNVPILTEAYVMGILANPWLPDGATYGNRIRANTAYLARKMEQAITEAVGNGWDINRTARRIQHIAGEGFYNAVRLARTELNRVASQGASHFFMENADILDGKRWNATLDARTATKDANNDGKAYELDYDTVESPGVPGQRIPNHPNCRCKYSPVLSALGVSEKERIARGKEDTPTKFGERTYTKARTYKEYAKERGLPDIEERLRNDEPRKYLRRGEKINAYDKNSESISTTSTYKSNNIVSDNVKLTKEDQQSLEKVDQLLKGIALNDRRKLASDLMERSGLGHINVAIRSNINANGYCRFEKGVSKVNIIEYVLEKQDARPYEYQVKTALHEFYHANMNGLKIDKNFGALDWVNIEETATESAALYLKKAAGITKEITPAYSDKLIWNLPRLKQLEEFKDCTTIEDFGAKFLKYRFSDNSKTVEWTRLANNIDKQPLDMVQYAKQYEKHVLENKNEILEMLFDAVTDTTKVSKKEFYKQAITKSFEEGWNVYQDKYGLAFTQSLIIAMNRLGVK